MSLNYSAMFTIICMLGSFVAVYCQAPVAFNLPSANVAASGSSQLYSGVGTGANSGSAVGSSGPDPNVELFAHTVLQLLLTNPVLNAVPDLVITDPYATITKVAENFVKKESTKFNITKSNLAEVAADGSRAVGVITKNLFFNTVARVVPKLLRANKPLSQKVTTAYPKILVDFQEAYGVRDGIFDADSFVEALVNGFLAFIDFSKINNYPNIVLTLQLYLKELTDLATGVEV